MWNQTTCLGAVTATTHTFLRLAQLNGLLGHAQLSEGDKKKSPENELLICECTRVVMWGQLTARSANENGENVHLYFPDSDRHFH